MIASAFTLLATAVVAFLATDIDDLALLTGWFSDRTYRAADIAIGQLLGVAALIAMSAILGLAGFFLPTPVLGLLGVLPVGIGISRFVSMRESEENETASAIAGVLAVAGVTIAHGSDNIAIYAPLLATQTLFGAAAVSHVFLSMTGLWIALAHWFARHPAWAPFIQTWGRRITPWLLILLGGNILYEAGTIDWLTASGIWKEIGFAPRLWNGREALGALSVAMALLACGIYVWQTLAGQIRPHPLSWFLFGILSATGYWVQRDQGAGAGGWVLMTMTILCFLLAGLSFAKGERRFPRREWAFLVAGCVAFLFYLFAREPNIAALLTTGVDALGFGPTFARGWSHPRKDSVTSFALNAAKFVPSLLAMQSVTLATCIYPATLLVLNGAVSIMLVLRRRVVA
jgi:cadmium resistance protein CadD (predicted permease)